MRAELRAEAASHVLLHHPHLILLQAERVGDLPPRAEDVLRRAPQRQRAAIPPATPPCGSSALCSAVGVSRPRLHRHVGLRQRALHVAARINRRRTRPRCDCAGRACSTWARPLAERRLRIDHERQRLVLDASPAPAPPRPARAARPGSARRDRPDTAPPRRRSAGCHATGSSDLRVEAVQHRSHPGQRLCPAASIATTRACGYGERNPAANSIPGSRTS